jgi:hypothetical protein
MSRKKIYGLCHRCEYRARHLEDGSGPRYECKQAGQAVYSCYMYSPVAPLVTVRDKGDRRGHPATTGHAFSARIHALGIAECSPRVTPLKKGVVAWWEPKGEEC